LTTSAPTYKINYPQTPFLDEKTKMPTVPWQQWLQNPSVSTLSVGGGATGGSFSGIAITSSTVDSTTIGATTPSSGIFTALKTTQSLSLSYLLVGLTNGGSYVFGNNLVAVLNGSGAITGYTVTMPSTPVDGQINIICTNQPIASFTVNPNGGQTLNGSPGSLAGGQGIGFIFTSNAWYRIY